MNLLENQFSYRRSLKLLDMRARDQTKRIFGRDITNLERKGKNSSIYEKATLKTDVRIRSRSFANSKKEKETKKDAIHEYEDDIVKFMIDLQKAEANETLNEISEKMRQILIDWLVDVHESFELKEQTLYLTLAYLNQYASKNQITKEDYQLVGITCLWIASKYEEIYPPRMNNYVEVTANTYSVQDLKRMEGEIINCLDFNLNYITPLSILESLHSKLTPMTTAMCKYLIETAMLENLSKKYSPLLLVVSSVSLCDSIYKTKTDLTSLKQLGNFSKDDIVECFKCLCSTIHHGNKYSLKAIKRKFLKQKYHSVSKIRLDPK